MYIYCQAIFKNIGKFGIVYKKTNDSNNKFSLLKSYILLL